MNSQFAFNSETNELVVNGPEYKPYPGGIGKFYFDRMKELAYGDEEIIAQIDAETGETETYKDLFETTVKLAQYMRNSMGVKPGDLVAMCSYNTKYSAVVMIATYFVGAVMASTDPILSFEDTKYLLHMIKPKVIFVSQGSEKLIDGAIRAHKLPTQIVTFARSNEHVHLDVILNQAKFSANFEPYFVDNLDDTCSILFSSGTTGMPKGIVLSHHYFLAPMSSHPPMILKWVLLNYASLYWISSVYMLAMAVALGSSRLLCRTFHKEKHWELVKKYQVNYLTLSNTYCMESSKYLDENMKLPHLQLMIVAGGQISDKDMAFYTAQLTSTKVGYIYALTEGSVVAQFQKGDKFASVGKPAAVNQTIKIVDPDTEDKLPLNKVGEIRIKRKYQMTGYYKVDSSDAWDNEGFLKTGDLGYLDDDFNLFVIDRIKEMFKYRSWHVVPAKIENVLSNHPDVLYATVVGKPTYNEDEYHCMAIVCLHDGSKATAEEIEQYANAQLDEINKIRAGVHFVDKKLISFTPTGKINRRMLKNMFIQKKK